jgi:hypothetical protein
MNIVYEHIDNESRNSHGIAIGEQECRGHLQGEVKDNLLDREEWQNTLDIRRNNFI